LDKPIVAQGIRLLIAYVLRHLPCAARADTFPALITQQGDSSPMPFAIKPRQTLLFTGDSITDCGRRDVANPLGQGYVKMACDLIVARYPQHQLKTINTGIGGHTVRDLAGRWTDDVIRYRPDWLSIMIGINDVHGQLTKVPHGVSPKEYAELYDAILARVKKETKAQIILIDPFYLSIDSDSGNWRSTVLKNLQPYIRTVHAMVRKHKTRHVRLHENFQRLMKNYSADQFCPEPVHPNPSGHLAMAEAWLREMGW
jgi:acyl-CoA thioesterase-1